MLSFGQWVVNRSSSQKVSGVGPNGSILPSRIATGAEANDNLAIDLALLADHFFT
jgi:hypothetical protein